MYGRYGPLEMCSSAVTEATRTSAFSLAYMRWRRWPGCTMSNVPWHMMTRRRRGRRPISSASSCGVLILCENFAYMPLLSQPPEPLARRGLDLVDGPQRRAAPVLDVVQHDGDAALEAHGRLPTECAADLRDVGVRAVGLARALGQAHDVAAAEQLDEAVDALRATGPDVEDLATRVGARREQIGPRHVGDEDEVARLRALADDGERVARQLLAQEHAEDGAVRARRP